MNSAVVLVLIGIVGIIGVSQATDYCSKTICVDAKHIACKNKGEFARTCSKDRKLVTMTADLKDALVKRHNELRNSLALGSVPGFQSSTKMATMQWDDELATLAALNVKTCKFDHDACHNTDKFSQSGQNIAETASTSPFTVTDKTIALPLVDDWWSEKKDTTMKEINKYPENFRAVIGHFTVMTVDANDRLGCAISTFKDPAMNNWYAYLMTCNYARTNIVDGKSYTAGKTASECKTGTNPNFKGLCSEQEKY